MKPDRVFNLELRDCCIHTAVKRRHEHLVKACMKAHARGITDHRTESELEVLTYLLENGDFAFMRSLSKDLSCGRGTVRLSVSRDFTRVHFSLDGDRFPMEWKRQKN